MYRTRQFDEWRDSLISGAILAAFIAPLVVSAPCISAAYGNVRKPHSYHSCGLFTLPASNNAKVPDDHKKKTRLRKKPVIAPALPAPVALPAVAPPPVQAAAPPPSPFEGSWRIHSTHLLSGAPAAADWKFSITGNNVHLNGDWENLTFKEGHIEDDRITLDSKGGVGSIFTGRLVSPNRIQGRWHSFNLSGDWSADRE